MNNTIPAPETLPGHAQRPTQLLATGTAPVWIRPPKSGIEPHTGLTRSYLYQLASAGIIRSVSLLSAGKKRGCRLFHLPSILEFIASQEVSR